MTTWIVLLVAFEGFLLLAWAIEYADRRMRSQATHHCKPGCPCRGTSRG